MRTWTGAAAVVLGATTMVAGGCAHAQSPRVVMHGQPEAAASILAADRAFAARSAHGGAAAAFREYMDPVDGRAFNGGDPARGAAAIAEAAPRGRLTWTPSEVFAARDGDMGVTWGLWRFAPPGQAAPEATGRYVTVWRRDAAGAWKGIIDIGSPDAAPNRPSAAPPA